MAQKRKYYEEIAQQRAENLKSIAEEMPEPQVFEDEGLDEQLARHRSTKLPRTFDKVASARSTITNKSRQSHAHG